MNRERLRAAARPLAAAAAVLFFVIWVGRSYEQRRVIEDARQALRELARLEDVHKSLYGEYTDDPGRLADLTDDWHATMESLNALIDFRAGFAVQHDRYGYRLEAHARDRRRTLVVQEGPAKRSLTAASNPAR